MTWATFPHLFADYYVCAYATGISGANALAGKSCGEPNTVKYLATKSGNLIIRECA
jgi:oligoendopeptidase F